MSASDLQEVMETICAPNVVSHMMTVKAFARDMRAHLLIAEALLAISVSESLPCELPYDYIKEDFTELREESMEIDTVNIDLRELITLHDGLYEAQITTTDIESSLTLHRLVNLLEQKKTIMKS